MEHSPGAIYIPVKVRIPEGPTCAYPPKDGDARGYTCNWILPHSSGQKWCRLFDEPGVEIEDIRIVGLMKCKRCVNAVRKEVRA